MPRISAARRRELAENDWFAKLVLIVAIVDPLTALPQIIEIWSSKSAEDVSFPTWSLFVVSAIIWLIYGLRIRSKPLIASGIMCIITESIVVIGILIYG